MKPVTPAASERTVRAIPPAAATPTSTLIEQLKAVGELKEPKAVEAPAQKAEASDSKPVETKAVETKPAVAKPVEATSVTPAPTAAKPVETKPVEKKATESKPVQASEAKQANKRIVRKRETDEQKARRIAAKYGISW